MSEFSDLKYAADIGEDFKAFFGSEIGKYLTARANRDEMMALRTLADISPSDSDAIFKAQVKAQVPRQVITWLNEVVKAGQDAQYLIKNMEGDGDDY